MTINLPPKARLVAYIVTALGTPVVAYLKVKGFIGDAETALWGAEITVVSALAAFNVSEKSGPGSHPDNHPDPFDGGHATNEEG